MNGGTLIRVIPKTLFDFGYLPGSTTDGVIVAKALNVIPYSSAHLWVRVYQRRVDTGASAQVVVTGALPDENTQFSFLDSSSTTLTISGTAPTLLNAAWPAGSALPPYLQIEVQGTQPGTPSYIGVEISIDLLVRCCG